MISSFLGSKPRAAVCSKHAAFSKCRHMSLRAAQAWWSEEVLAKKEKTTCSIIITMMMIILSSINAVSFIYKLFLCELIRLSVNCSQFFISLLGLFSLNCCFSPFSIFSLVPDLKPDLFLHISFFLHFSSECLSFMVSSSSGFSLHAKSTQLYSLKTWTSVCTVLWIWSQIRWCGNASPTEA